MKTRKYVTKTLTAALSLALCLSAGAPAYAITGMAVAEEVANEGISDTLAEGANPVPDYAGSVVDSILMPPVSEPANIVITQEGQAEPSAPAPEQVIVKYYPVPAPEPTPTPEPVAESAPEEQELSPPTQELPAEGKVLGVSAEKESTDPRVTELVYALDSVLEGQTDIRDSAHTILLVVFALLPFMAVMFFLQVRLFGKKTAKRSVIALNKRK